VFSHLGTRGAPVLLPGSFASRAIVCAIRFAAEPLPYGLTTTQPTAFASHSAVLIPATIYLVAAVLGRATTIYPVHGEEFGIMSYQPALCGWREGSVYLALIPSRPVS
jgi:hypothetical protein